jgi:hypothetical protein
MSNYTEVVDSVRGRQEAQRPTKPYWSRDSSALLRLAGSNGKEVRSGIGRCLAWGLYPLNAGERR